MTDAPPRIENAPGLIWKPRKAGWEARWQARTDLVERGYRPRSARLWTGVNPDPIEVEFVQSRCRILQDEMLNWGRGDVRVVSAFTGDFRSLIACYETDPDSPYHKIRYVTKRNYRALLKRIYRDCADTQIADLKARDVLRLYEGWVKPDVEGGRPKATIGHSLIGMVRTLVNFGATILDSGECERVANMLHRMKFKVGKPRSEQITADQAAAVRAELHRRGHHSAALAQAGQFDFTWRQKDMIGEWVPNTEAGISDIIAGNNKWLRGVRWEELGADMVLVHVTSKRQKKIVINVLLAPMVMEEFRLIAGVPEGAPVTRDMLPAAGPMVVCESTTIPWFDNNFRTKWREAARAVGIPDNVFNMDSRAGAITEGVEATDGDMDAVRVGATHSNVSQTQNYSRGDAKRIETLMSRRAAHRNKTGTPGS